MTMDTCFAPAERADADKLQEEIDIISNNPVIDGVLQSVSGLLAVLNEHRQILAVNNSLLQMLGIENAIDLLGLRPGEALKCVHSCEEPSGCGTTKYCSTCGAAVAIVSSLGTEEPVERLCALTAEKGGARIDLVLVVRSHPLRVEGKKFLLLFLQDITRQQQRAALERTFFHDINNMLSGMLGASELLVNNEPNSPIVRIVRQLSLRLAKEVDIQRCLLQRECEYHVTENETTISQIIEELKHFYANHPTARGKNLHYPGVCPDLRLQTDISLCLRVIFNMVTNALEATEDNGDVKIWLEEGEGCLSFCVWNRQVIPDDVALRVFQRNFSTKDEAGRGTGTYAMKLLGEEILGGRVEFISLPEEGTIFRFSLPCGIGDTEVD